MDTQNNYSTLIINSSRYQSVSSAIPLTFVSSSSAAKAALEDRSKRFAAIFIDPILPNPGGLSLIALAHRCRPATPVFILHNTSQAPPFPLEELRRLGIHESLPMPLSSWTIKERIASEIFDYYFEPVPEVPAFSQTSEEDRKYVAVPAADFLTGTVSLYDAYIRLPSGKYFQVLNARTKMDPSRALSYIEKGVTHFFISKTGHRRCLDYCDTLAKFLLTHPQVSFSIKVSDVMNRGQVVIDAIRSHQLAPEHIDFAQTYIAQIRALLRQTRLDQDEHIRAFLANLPAYDRAVSVTMVAALLALPLKVESETAFRAIGMAALLHDVGLYQMPPEVQLENVSVMTPEQAALYYSHPLAGAKILAALPDVDEVVVQAVAQHHERRNSKGFPGNFSADEINRVAELIGMADEFVSLLLKAAIDPSVNVIGEMEKMHDAFSYPVINSFREVFLKPLSSTAAA